MENIQYEMEKKKKKLGCNSIIFKKENDETRMTFFN